jgi:hypothetical protein
MLRPKVLNERPKDYGNTHFFGCSQKIILALLADHNFEIRIGSNGWVSQAQVQSGAGHGLGEVLGTCHSWARCCCPPPHLGQVGPSTQAHYSG